MKKGFVLYPLLLTSFLLASLVFVGMRTVGMGVAAARLQGAQEALFSKLCVVVSYHQRLITNFYDLIRDFSQSQKKNVESLTPFDALLRCSVERDATLQDGLCCESIVGGSGCRWRVRKQGSGYVFSGHTFFTV